METEFPLIATNDSSILPWYYLILSYGWLVFLVGIALYIYGALALMTIAKKTNTPNAWLAWIPIANLYLMTQIAKVPWWTIFGVLLALIPVIGGWLMLALVIWWWWKICEARNKPGWWAILIGIIPVVNLIMIGVIAWANEETASAVPQK